MSAEWPQRGSNAWNAARVRELEAAADDVVTAHARYFDYMTTQRQEELGAAVRKLAALAASPVERGAANEPWNCTRPGGCRSPLACSARAEVEPGYCLHTAQARLAAAGGA